MNTDAITLAKSCNWSYEKCLLNGIWRTILKDGSFEYLWIKKMHSFHLERSLENANKDGNILIVEVLEAEKARRKQVWTKTIEHYNKSKKEMNTEQNNTQAMKNSKNDAMLTATVGETAASVAASLNNAADSDTSDISDSFFKPKVEAQFAKNEMLDAHTMVVDVRCTNGRGWRVELLNTHTGETTYITQTRLLIKLGRVKKKPKKSVNNVKKPTNIHADTFPRIREFTRKGKTYWICNSRSAKLYPHGKEQWFSTKDDALARRNEIRKELREQLSSVAVVAPSNFVHKWTTRYASLKGMKSNAIIKKMEEALGLYYKNWNMMRNKKDELCTNKSNVCKHKITRKYNVGDIVGNKEVLDYRQNNTGTRGGFAYRVKNITTGNIQWIKQSQLNSTVLTLKDRQLLQQPQLSFFDDSGAITGALLKPVAPEPVAVKEMVAPEPVAVAEIKKSRFDKLVDGFRTMIS